MNTTLIYTSPARGHLYPMMDVALALRAVGHRVVVQSLADERERVVDEGLMHRPIAAAIEALGLEDYRGGNPIAQIRATFDGWLARAPHEVHDLRATCADLDPDLLVVDANTWGAAAFAETRRRPWAMFLTFALQVA
jgi:UDP:flavonoid glycosyltransferase YjiC (YdhE family)